MHIFSLLWFVDKMKDNSCKSCVWWLVPFYIKSADDLPCYQKHPIKMESQVRKLDRLGWTQFIRHFVCFLGFFCLIKKSYEHFATCTYVGVWANTSNNNNRLHRLTNGMLPAQNWRHVELRIPTSEVNGRRHKLTCTLIICGYFCHLNLILGWVTYESRKVHRGYSRKREEIFLLS